MGKITAALLLILSTPVVVLMTAGTPAHAAICGTRSEIVKTLTGRYGEQRLASGLVGTTEVVEIFTSAKGTFTIVTTTVNGRTCVVGAGVAWSLYPQNFDQKS